MEDQPHLCRLSALHGAATCGAVLAMLIACWSSKTMLVLLKRVCQAELCCLAPNFGRIAMIVVACHLRCVTTRCSFLSWPGP